MTEKKKNFEETLKKLEEAAQKLENQTTFPSKRP